MDPDDDIQSNKNDNGNNANNAESRIKRINHSEEIDAKYGFVRHRTTNEKIGWLINFQSVKNLIFFKLNLIYNILPSFFLKDRVH